LVSTLGGIALAIYLESCDLSQLSVPEILARVEAAPPPPAEASTRTEPPVHNDPAVRPAARLALEPAVTQQFDLEKITQSLQRTEAAQQEMVEQQNRSWEVLNTAIESMRDVATLKVQEARPPEPSAEAQPEAPIAPPPLDAPQTDPEPIATPTQSAKPLIIPDEGDDKLTIVIQDSEIREVLELLSEQGQLNILPSQNVQGRVSASLSKVDIRTALAAILRS